MILVPPYEQYGGHYTVGTPASGFNSDYVNLVVPSAATSTVQLDGAAVPSSSFTAIGSSAYSGASIQISPGSHRFTATAPFGVTLYGYFPEDTFGYQGGMVLDTARAGTTLTSIPSSVTQLVGTQFCTIASALDPYGVPVGGVGVGFTVTGTNTSSQSVDTTATGQASYYRDPRGTDTHTCVCRTCLCNQHGYVEFIGTESSAGGVLREQTKPLIFQPPPVFTARSAMTACQPEALFRFRGLRSADPAA